jgi:hypothetical protein
MQEKNLATLLGCVGLKIPQEVFSGRLKVKPVLGPIF